MNKPISQAIKETLDSLDEKRVNRRELCEELVTVLIKKNLINQKYNKEENDGE